MATVTIYDAFEVTGPVKAEMTASYQGMDPGSPSSFGQVIEPLVFQTSSASVLQNGATVTLDGEDWTVSRLTESHAYMYAENPMTATAMVEADVYVITLTNGAATRNLMVAWDSTNRPLIDANGNPQPVTHIQLIYYFDRIYYINTAMIAADDPNRMGALCFASGTMIDTATGPRPVQGLRVGDLVRTRDHGFQPLRWLGGRRLSGRDLARAPQLVPIRIAAGALGPGTPAQDLTVSPQHRILVRSRIAERIARAPEVLIAAVHLLGLPGVSRCPASDGVGYWHLMFDAHEIVFANGAEAESLYLGPMAMQSLTNEAMAEIAALFPDLAAGGDVRSTVRPVMRGGQTRQLVERQVRNSKPLVSPLCPA